METVDAPLEEEVDSWGVEEVVVVTEEDERLEELGVLLDVGPGIRKKIPNAEKMRSSTTIAERTFFETKFLVGVVSSMNHI